MKRDDLLVTAGETIAYAEDYIDTKVEILKLTVAERGSKTAADLIAGAVVAGLGLFAGVLFILALAIVLGKAIGSLPAGFALIGVLILVLAVLIFVFRKPLLINPLLRALLSSLFNPGPDGK